MQKNIWVAAGDGDLARVQHLVESQGKCPSAHLALAHPSPGLSPNIPDPFSYTPMHAAASYAQLDVLAYLISRGGDVNITDDDGDTPLYTVENIDTARFLIDHGATIARHNTDGISPIEHLSDDFPAVAAFLQAHLSASASASTTTATAAPAPAPPSQHQQNAASEQLTSALLADVEDIMARAAAEGRDPDPELRAAVSRTVLEGVVQGFQMTEDADDDERRRVEADSPAKRARTEGG
ncbi:hypothetical protein H0H81_008955 [Sphagnurus paluster]|uniref:Ankyrin n=1 Tax=Sphagnurus paluster TaxID=117069 RepID=A0A9P7K8L4_9AGAR|nr:hypothetical protein H0H81_008955 [Sphagnurus paluster]